MEMAARMSLESGSLPVSIGLFTHCKTTIIRKMSVARLRGISLNPMSDGGKIGGKKMVGLTARKVEGVKEPGMYGDGAVSTCASAKAARKLGFCAPPSMGIAANLDLDRQPL
jgi:hypothetical protein